MVFFIYLGCLAIGLTFTVITAVAGHIFGGHDHDGSIGSHGHAEAGSDWSDGPGVSAFSPTIISSFITAFGAFGVIFNQFPATKNPFVSAPLAVLGGFVAAAGMLQLLRKLFKKTQSSSESRVSTLIGQIATTATTIPENGVGEIAYVQAGTRYTAPAREEEGRPVASGRSVKITRVVGTQFYVTAS